MISPRVVITDGAFPNFAQEEMVLQSVNGKLLVGQCQTEDDVLELAADADALIVQWAPISRRVIEGLKRCKMIARYGIGIDTIDIDAASENGVLVSNAGDYCVTEVAEHTLALILACARKLKHFDYSIRKGEWDAIQIGKPMHRFSCQTVGIFGFGTIGEIVSRMVDALGFSTIAYDPYRGLLPSPTRQVDLDTLLAESDYITIHAPMIPSMRGFFNAEKLRKMKRTAFLINTARGAIINEQDLLASIRANEITGAALDVFEQEPLLADNPIRAEHRILMSPHAAYYSDQALLSLQREPAEEVARFFRGESPKWTLNSDRVRPLV